MSNEKLIAEIQKRIEFLEKKLSVARDRFGKDPINATQWFPDEIPSLAFELKTYKQAINGLEGEATIDSLVQYFTRSLIFLSQKGFQRNRIESIELEATGKCLEFLIDFRDYGGSS